MSYQTDVRPATPNDVHDIQRVARATWHAVYDDILGAEAVDAMLDEGYTDDRIEGMVDVDDIGLFVATADGEVVGYGSCGMTDLAGIGDLDIYVHPDYWGEGTGERLLDREKKHLRSLSVRTVRDEVLVDNDVGNGFYRKHFEHAGERTVDFGGARREANVYELSLVG